jgi:hypothetical protein
MSGSRTMSMSRTLSRSYLGQVREEHGQDQDEWQSHGSLGYGGRVRIRIMFMVTKSTRSGSLSRSGSGSRIRIRIGWCKDTKVSHLVGLPFEKT